MADASGGSDNENRFNGKGIIPYTQRESVAIPPAQSSKQSMLKIQ
jgi:hypothetical protein